MSSIGSDVYAVSMPKPTDKTEHARLGLQHRALLAIMNGATHLAPVVPSRVLDLGCGSGAWALEVAAEYPQCSVTGMDLNPPELEDTPSNCRFMRLDITKPWSLLYGSTYDLIHARMLTYAIQDWRLIFDRCWEHLAPGGWIELLDLRLPFEAGNSMANAENSAFLRFSATQELAWQRLGFNSRAADHHEQLLQLRGYINTKTKLLHHPMGSWPETERDKFMGSCNYENWAPHIKRMGPRLLAMNLGMSLTDAEVIIDTLCKDIEENGRENQYYTVTASVYGQKPSTPGS